MSGKLGDHKVWDLPVRLFHWSLVALVLLLWVTGEFGGLDLTLSLPGSEEIYLSNMDIHALAGQGVLVLVIFRLLWGVWGSTTARFSHFIKHPLEVVAEATDLLKGRIRDTVGHNPLGGMMVLVLLLLLGTQAVTGMFSADEFFYEGPLTHLVSDDTVETVTGVHHLIFSILQALVVIHILAVIYYLIRRKNLIRPMVTGRKPHEIGGELAFSPWWLALLSLGVAIAALLALRSL